MTSRSARIASALLILGLAATAANAQRQSYRERDSKAQAGQFDYYLLALSWSPTYCAGLSGNRTDPQCHGRTARPYGFVLHGLWPQFERGWPQYCRSDDRGFVPRPVARRMLDIMPSDKLIFNEYRKHGTCSGLGVDGYFALARRLYDKVKIPRRFQRVTDERLIVNRDDVIEDFLTANPQLKPDMLAVACGGPGNRLREVRICFDRGGNFRHCGPNENQRKLCSADRLYVPPVRGGSGASQSLPDDRPSRPQQDILPGPRDERRL
jgi:ribonuclease T2